jgi:hypothetical protein
MKPVVNDMSPKYEVERPSENSVRSSCSSLSRLSQLLLLKERVGPEKYSKIRYFQTLKKTKRNEPKSKIKINKKEIKDLCTKLETMSAGQTKSVGKAFNTIVKRVDKKLERQKDHFKNQRWKRIQILEAQSGNEYVSIPYDALFKDDQQSKLIFDLPRNLIPEIVDYITRLNEIRCFREADYIKLVNAHIKRLETYYKKKEDNVLAKITYKRKLYNGFNDVLGSLSCPYCAPNQKCAVCILDDPRDLFTTHQARVIEDIAIAFIQIVTQRNIQTFVLEFIRIIKTMYGVSICKFDYVNLLPSIINPILSLMGYTTGFLEDTTGLDVFKIVEFFQKLFDRNETFKPAQADVPTGPDPALFGYKPMDEMGITDTLASDWMETDLFTFVSNWFCYMCYLCVSKKQCAHMPIFGDLMKSTIGYGKDISADLMKYTIKTIEFIMKKGRFMLTHNFITTFYHNKSSLISLRTRYDRICENYPARVNPSIYEVDYEQYAADVASLRRELTELSRVGTNRVREEICKMLSKIILIDNDLRSDKHVYRDRMSPYSLLIWGNTSIAKTVFTQITTKANCDFHDLPYAPEFIYTMNEDERMDGYKSNMHTIISDDAGNRNPNVCPTGDPVVSSIIQIDNNIAAVTRQADLDSKGKVPIHSLFHYMTANTEHINSMFYMTHPSAVMRRFNYILKLELKPGVATDGMFDYKKVEDPDVFNFWNIYVGKYIPGTDREQRNGRVEYEIEPITNIDNYFLFLARTTKEHFKQQKARMDSLKNFSKLSFKKCGHRSGVDCACTDDPASLPEHESLGTFTNGVYYVRPRNQVRVLSPQGPWEYIRVIDGGLLEGSYNIARSSYKYLPNFYKCCEIGTTLGSTALETCTDMTLYCARQSSRWGAKFKALESLLRAKNLMTKKIESGCDPEASQWEVFAETLFPDESTVVSFVTKLTATLTGLYIGYKLYKGVTETKQTTNIVFVENEKPKSTAPQGAIIVKEKTAFWTDNSNVLRDSDVGASALFYKDKPQEFLNLVANNTVLLECELKSGAFLNIRALCLGGWCYVTNAHYLHDREFVALTLIQDRVGVANCNIHMTYNFKNAIIDTQRDLVYFYLKDNKPKRNISLLFYQGNLDDCIFDGCYLARLKDGSIKQTPLTSIKPATDNIGFKNGTVKCLKTFQAMVAEPTSLGDCGAPMIAFTNFGPTIVGIHVTGLDNSVSASRLGTREIAASNIDLRPDLTATRFKFDSAYKTLVPERLVSHPAFLPESSTVFRYGSIKEGGSRMKSTVVRTDMAPEFEKLGYVQLKAAPPMNHYKIFNKNLKDMTQKDSLVDEDILAKCVDAYCAHTIDNIPQSEFDQMGTISDEANVNGIPGVDYIDKINRNTSMGFPWCKPKKKYLYPIANEEYPDGVCFDAEVMEEYRRIEYVSRTGCMSQSVYQASQKDEPLPIAKCEDYGTRLFFGAPAPKVLLNRKYFLSIIRFVQRNRKATRIAIGTVVQSRQWGDLKAQLKWENRIIAGDYSKFDKKQQVRILHAAFDILERWAKHSGQYTRVDLQSMLSQRADIVYALVHFDGDLMAFLGVLPSGNPLTTLLNCLCNLLLDMYAYVSAGNDIKEYFEEVTTIVYGDDSISSVSPRCTNFNHTIKQRELAKIGITFTMAEKDRPSEPFIPLSEATFLKRKFVYDEKYDIWLAPLEESNIVSSLMVWNRSKNLTPAEQAYASMQNSAREFFFHGEDKYNEMCEIYTGVYERTYHREIQFPVFEEIMDAFESYSKDEDTIKECQSGLEYVYPINYQTDRLIFLMFVICSCFYCIFGYKDIPTNHWICYIIVFISFAASLIILLQVLIEKCARRRVINVPQGSLTTSESLLKAKLRDRIFERGLERLIMDYIGCCRIWNCTEEHHRNGMCEFHHATFKQMLFLRNSFTRVHFCFACGSRFGFSTETHRMEQLCLSCWCFYVCGGCTLGRLCNTHRKFEGYYFNVSPEQYIFAYTAVTHFPNNVVGDREVYFRNHHHALGVITFPNNAQPIIVDNVDLLEDEEDFRNAMNLNVDENIFNVVQDL